jgi:hypothetical protein
VIFIVTQESSDNFSSKNHLILKMVPVVKISQANEQAMSSLAKRFESLNCFPEAPNDF